MTQQNHTKWHNKTTQSDTTKPHKVTEYKFGLSHFCGFVKFILLNMKIEFCYHETVDLSKVHVSSVNGLLCIFYLAHTLNVKKSFAVLVSKVHCIFLFIICSIFPMEIVVYCCVPLFLIRVSVIDDITLSHVFFFQYLEKAVHRHCRLSWVTSVSFYYICAKGILQRWTNWPCNFLVFRCI